MGGVARIPLIFCVEKRHQLQVLLAQLDLLVLMEHPAPFEKKSLSMIMKPSGSRYVQGISPTLGMGWDGIKTINPTLGKGLDS